MRWITWLKEKTLCWSVLGQLESVIDREDTSKAWLQKAGWAALWIRLHWHIDIPRGSFWNYVQSLDLGFLCSSSISTRLYVRGTFWIGIGYSTCVRKNYLVVEASIFQKSLWPKRITQFLRACGRTPCSAHLPLSVARSPKRNLGHLFRRCS